MGLVVSARHLTLDQVVAIKFLIAHRFGTREESIARFASEARAAAKIQSDYVCRVSDVGMMPNGIPYMIMEYLEGNDLEEEIVHRGQLDVVEAVDYLLQALDAMAAAHRLGIVHRDLKPANIFLARRPDGSRRVKVLDFGISKATDVGINGKQRITKETRSFGTPAYMPPEQIRDPMNVDHRVDIWALGCILYEAITGQMAFVGESVKEVLDRVLTEAPCPISSLRRDVPPGLIAIVERALSRHRDERFSSAALFARSLAYFGSFGVLSGLVNIQSEVGSLSSISAVPLARPLTPAAAYASAPYSSMPYPAASPSVEPMVVHHGSAPPSAARRAFTTEPDPTEISRRHHITQGHFAAAKRSRQAKSAVMATGTVVLVAAAVAILIHRLGVLEAQEQRQTEQTVAAAAPPPPAAQPLPPAAPSPPSPPSATPPANPAVAAAAPAAPAKPAPAPQRPAGTNVHPASSSVHVTRSSLAAPRSRPR